MGTLHLCKQQTDPHSGPSLAALSGLDALSLPPEGQVAFRLGHLPRLAPVKARPGARLAPRRPGERRLRSLAELVSARGQLPGCPASGTSPPSKQPRAPLEPLRNKCDGRKAAQEARAGGGPLRSCFPDREGLRAPELIVPRRSCKKWAHVVARGGDLGPGG